MMNKMKDATQFLIALDTVTKSFTHRKYTDRVLDLEFRALEEQATREFKAFEERIEWHIERTAKTQHELSTQLAAKDTQIKALDDQIKAQDTQIASFTTNATPWMPVKGCGRSWRRGSLIFAWSGFRSGARRPRGPGGLETLARAAGPVDLVQTGPDDVAEAKG